MSTGKSWWHCKSSSAGCWSWNMWFKKYFRVIMRTDLTKDLYKIGAKDVILNSWYARNQFSTCTEGTVNIAVVPSVNISLRECAWKVSLFGGLGYRRCNCKTSYRSNLCSFRKSNKLCNSKCHNSLWWENKWHLFWDYHFYISFVLFFFFLLLADVMKNYFCLFPCIIFWFICKQLFVFLFSIYYYIR